jgi:hypothetical protein
MISFPLMKRVLIEHRRGIYGWTLGIVALVTIQSLVGWRLDVAYGCFP